MSDNLPRLAQLVRRDLERASPVITSTRLDDMIGMAHDWRRVGLPSSSMGGGNGHGSGPADPTSQDATTVDEGNVYHARLVAALEQVAAGLRVVVQLDMEAPVSAQTCDSCGRIRPADMRHGRCGACRKRLRRAA